MELVRVKNKTWVKLIITEDFKVPPGGLELSHNQYIFFDHIDGMYSYCTDVDGNLVHPVAWAEVEVVEDHKILREIITWGGRGINGTDIVATYRKIKDISDSHLQNLVSYLVGHKTRVRSDVHKAVEEEVKYRKEFGIKVEDYESDK